MHNWWWEIRQGFSHVVKKTNDVWDRRLETADNTVAAAAAVAAGGDNREAREEKQHPRSHGVEGAGEEAAAAAKGRAQKLQEKVFFYIWK